MTKTLVRASGAVDRLRGAFSHIDTSGVPFDTLQFVLMDRPSGYIHLEGTGAGDRLFQVHIGAGDLPSGAGKERDFVAGLARTIHTAVNELPVSESIIRDMKAAIERVNTDPALHRMAARRSGLAIRQPVAGRHR
jgi:hypothetical protein